MKKWDQALHGLSVGIGASAVGAAGVSLIKFGAPQEAVLSLLGALIGASATVAGAAWLADRNSRVEQDAELRLLIDEYQVIRNRALTIRDIDPGPDGEWSDEYRGELHKFGPPVREALAVTQEALEHGKRLTFRHRAMLRQMESACQRVWKFFHHCFLTDDEDHPEDERSWPWATNLIIEVTDKTIAELRKA